MIAHNNINYRALVTHTSRSFEPPTSRFDLWERVNNNNGSKFYEALHVHQARSNLTPTNRPDLWEPVPMTARGQLVKYCDPNDPEMAEFFNIGQNGTEEQAREVLGAALAVCHRVDPMPSAGITENALHFHLRDGSTFKPNPKPGTAYYETHSALITVSLPNSLAPGQSVTVNGRTMKPGSTTRCHPPETRASSSRPPTEPASPP